MSRQLRVDLNDEEWSEIKALAAIAQITIMDFTTQVLRDKISEFMAAQRKRERS